jgi:hypothetical protein
MEGITDPFAKSLEIVRFNPYLLPWVAHVLLAWSQPCMYAGICWELKLGGIRLLLDL